jgi:ammonia channel protein AmtB
MGHQLAPAVACAAWLFVVSCILLFYQQFPDCNCTSEEDKLKGLDFKYLNDVDESLIVLTGWVHDAVGRYARFE